MGLLPVLLVALLVLFLMMLGAIWAMNWTARKMVGETHGAIEAIVETGKVPESWRRPYEAKLVRLRDKPGQADRIANVEKRARQHYLQELDKLIRYVGKATLVEDEDVRRMLLERLADARARWQANPTGERGQ